MAYMASARRALTELPVNSSAMPHLIKSSTGVPTKRKRQLDELEDPEYPSSANRVRNPENSGPSTPSRESCEKFVDRIGKITSSGQARHHGLPETYHIEEMDERVSQNSSDGSTCSPPEFDAGDETTVSQETAATDVSHLALSMATIHAETLRLRLRVALFKVQTNQTNIPMSQLHISPDESERPVDVASSPTMKEFPTVQEAPPSKLLPAPVLRPTASPARRYPRQHIPPSPLNSKDNLPETATEVNLSRSSSASRHRLRPSLSHTGSPPDSPGYVRAAANRNESAMRTTVKGNH